MSHTFKGESCVIHYDDGYDGDAQIIGMSGQSVIVSVDDLLEFAANFVRQAPKFLVVAIEAMRISCGHDRDAPAGEGGGD